jgi:hypothetical protein
MGNLLPLFCSVFLLPFGVENRKRGKKPKVIIKYAQFIAIVSHWRAAEMEERKHRGRNLLCSVVPMALSSFISI